MPGSNHDVDASFMDALPISLREAGLDLIRFSALDELLEFRVNEPNEFLKNRFNLTPEQWFQVLNSVILTKVSYFQIERHFPNRYIDKLIDISAYAQGLDSNNPIDLYQSMLAEHPNFAAWVKNAIQVKQQNLAYERELETSA